MKHSILAVMHRAAVSVQSPRPTLADTAIATGDLAELDSIYDADRAMLAVTPDFERNSYDWDVLEACYSLDHAACWFVAELKAAGLWKS